MKNKLTSQIYCISLFKSKRYYAMKDYFKNKSLDVKFFKAISYKSKNFLKIRKCFNFQKHKLYNNGLMPSDREIACSISHTEAIRKSDTEKSLIILEDDARLKVRTSIFKSILLKLENTYDYDIILLGFSKSDKNTEKYLNLVNPFLRRINFNIKNTKFSIGDRFKHSTSGAVGYFISANAKPKILSFEKVYKLADDWSLLKDLGLRIGYLNPTVIREDISMISSLKHPQYFIRPLKTGFLMVDITLGLRRRILFCKRLISLLIYRLKEYNFNYLTNDKIS